MKPYDVFYALGATCLVIVNIFLAVLIGNTITILVKPIFSEFMSGLLGFSYTIFHLFFAADLAVKLVTRKNK